MYYTDLFLFSSAVTRYTLVRETKKPSFVRLDRKTNEEVKTQTKYLCEVCHAVVLVTVHGMAAMTPKSATYMFQPLNQ